MLWNINFVLLVFSVELCGIWRLEGHSQQSTLVIWKIYPGFGNAQPLQCSFCFTSLQMELADIKDIYVRKKEIPFSSEQKWMAVKCTLKNQVKQTEAGAGFMFLIVHLNKGHEMLSLQQIMFSGVNYVGRKRNKPQNSQLEWIFSL